MRACYFGFMSIAGDCSLLIWAPRVPQKATMPMVSGGLLSMFSLTCIALGIQELLDWNEKYLQYVSYSDGILIAFDETF